MNAYSFLDPRAPKWLKKAVRKAIMAKMQVREEMDWSDYSDRMLHTYYLAEAAEERKHIIELVKRPSKHMRLCLDACKRVRERAIKDGTWSIP